MEITSLGFRTDLALLTRGDTVVEDLGTHLVVRTPSNPTYFWGNFILLAGHPAPGGEKEVVGVFRSEFPDAEHVSIGIDVTGAPDHQDAWASRWADAGMSPDVSTVLTAERLVRPLATIADVELRALADDDDWEQRAQLEHALHPSTGEGEFMTFARARNAAERAQVEAGEGARLGAFLEGRLVSTAGVFVTEPGTARFQTVETHPDHRRQGIGATVVHAAGTHALDQLGARVLVIVADTDGEAIGIYRRLGFADRERQVMLEKRPAGWSA